MAASKATKEILEMDLYALLGIEEAATSKDVSDFVGVCFDKWAVHEM